jgi:hypothetical protein
MVTETYTDSEGKTRTRVRTESGWTTVDQGGEMIPFYLKDDQGVLLVRPEGATLEPLSLYHETCSPIDPIYYGKGPALAVPHSDHRRRFIETGLPLHTALYVMGQSRERADMVAPEIAADPAAVLFLISCRGEEKISSGFRWQHRGWLFFGLVLAIGGFVLRDQAVGLDRPIPFYAVVAGAYAGLAGLSWIWMVYNSLVALRQRVRQAWSQVDVQLKRRHDLIPNLVKAVQGFRGYEMTLQAELAKLRTQLDATPPGVAGPDYQACASLLVSIRERYPELRADSVFAALQRNLQDTEQRIALARGYFNEIATYFNRRLELVPDRFVAALAGLQPQALMAANEFERAPVEVTLASA